MVKGHLTALRDGCAGVSRKHGEGPPGCSKRTCRLLAGTGRAQDRDAQMRSGAAAPGRREKTHEAEKEG